MKPQNKREQDLKIKWNKCEHVWEDSGVVIDTSPPQETFYCYKCGAVTHDMKTKEYCFIKHYF